MIEHGTRVHLQAPEMWDAINDRDLTPEALGDELDGARYLVEALTVYLQGGDPEMDRRADDAG